MAADGTSLTLNEDGTGSFLEALKNAVRESAQRELDTHATINNLSWLAVKGSEVERQGYLTIENGKVTGIDWNAFISAIMRMKTAPAFDALDLASPENEEFGSVVLERRHFTAYSQTHDTAGGTLAEPELVAKMNQLTFIGNADTAPYWRIRHGAYDRDTALAIPYILQIAALLAQPIDPAEQLIQIIISTMRQPPRNSKVYLVSFVLQNGLQKRRQRFMNHRTDILDLRTALDVLRQTPGQLVETDVEVDPEAELSGVYRYVGAGGTVMRPTKVDGPAMVFHNVKGHLDTSVAIGVLASRQRVANLFGVKKEELGHLLCECAKNPIQPIVIQLNSSFRS